MMTRRRCSRFASAKVRLFRKPAKECERFFKKMTKKDAGRARKGGRRVDIPYYIINRGGEGGPTPTLPGREGGGTLDEETGNGKLTYPLRRFAPRPPVSGGQRKMGSGGADERISFPFSLFRFHLLSYPLRNFVPLSSVALGSFPRVALESAPLKGHESI